MADEVAAVSTYHVEAELAFDIEVAPGADARDHPLLIQIADLVMAQPNGSVGSKCVAQRKRAPETTKEPAPPAST